MNLTTTTSINVENTVILLDFVKILLNITDAGPYLAFGFINMIDGLRLDSAVLKASLPVEIASLDPGILENLTK